MIEIDVALVPAEARGWTNTVCIVVDELRASSTITTLLDLGCAQLYVTAGLREARRLAREHAAILAGERRGSPPPGFDYDNSPAALSRGDVRDRAVVLSTTNGTRILGQLTKGPATLVGCSRNARACVEAALELAVAADAAIGVVCSGRRGRFALDDAVVAGLLVERLVEAAAASGRELGLADEATAATRLRASYPDLITPLRECASGRLVERLGAGEDVDFCGQVDVSTSVGILRPGPPLAVERLTPERLSAERLSAVVQRAASGSAAERLSADERLLEGA